MKHMIPGNYKEMFKDRTVFITGMGRSGTTILGKLIGAMTGTYYLFEPAIVKAMLPTDGDPVKENNFLCTMFEDFFLNQVAGRTNPNRRDWTWGGNHFTAEDLEWRWENLGRRMDIMRYIEIEDPTWVIKMPEYQPFLEDAVKVFEGAKVIHIIRDGRTIVESALERSWFTEDYNENAVIEPCKFAVCPTAKGQVPLYVEESRTYNWLNWNQETRAAHSWRVLTDKGEEFLHEYGNGLTLSYESLCEAPAETAKILAEFCRAELNSLTNKHIKDIVEFEQEARPPFDASAIDPIEREAFFKAQEKYGYPGE